MMFNKNALALAICCGVLACLSALTAGLAPAFFVLIGFGAVFALWSALQMLRKPERVSIFALFRLSILWGYAFGPASAIWYWNPNDNISPILLAGEFAFIGYKPNLSYALASAYFAATLLTIVDAVAKQPVFAFSSSQRERHFDLSDRLFLFVLMSVVVVAVMQGELGYMGTQASEIGNVTAVGALAGVIAPALPSVFAWRLVQPDTSFRARILYLGLLIVAVMVVMVMGRRVLLFASLVAIVFMFWGAPRLRESISFKRTFSIARAIFAAMALGILVLGGMYAFYAIRLASGQLGEDSSLSQRIVLATQIMQGVSVSVDLDVYSDLYAYASEQSKARSGTLIGYLAALEGNEAHIYVYGDCAVAGVINAIPSVLMPQKKQLLVEYDCTDENLNARFALVQEDSPTTLLTQGYGDFGFLGLLLYPLVIAVVFNFAVAVIWWHRSFSFRLFATAAFMYGAMFVEQSLSFYFTTIREIVILAVVAVAIRHLTQLVPHRALVPPGVRASTQ
jgi:hypothetical protein